MYRLRSVSLLLTSTGLLAFGQLVGDLSPDTILSLNETAARDVPDGAPEIATGGAVRIEPNHSWYSNPKYSVSRANFGPFQAALKNA
jgi:hypothetical protein